MPKKYKMDEKVQADEEQAFNLRVQGHSQLDIAKKMGLTQQGVSLILKRVTKKYAKIFLDNVAHIKNEQVSQLENVASEAMAAWYRSINTIKIDEFGDPRYLHEFRKAKEAIRKILGMDLVEKELMESDMVGRIEIQVVGCEIPNKDVDLINDENTQD